MGNLVKLRHKMAAPKWLAPMVAIALVGSIVTGVPTSASADESFNTPTLSPSGCTGGPVSYSCPSPTVALSGTGANANAQVVVASSGGSWLGEAKSDGSGNWSLPVTLLQNATAYSLVVFEVDTSNNTEGPHSSPISITVTGNQLLTNGSFEQPWLGGYWANEGQTIPGWSATNGCGIEIQTPSTPDVGVTPQDGGSQYVELNSNCRSGVVQTVPTVPGTQYTLTFAYQSRPGTGPSQNIMSVQWGSQTVAASLQGVGTWTVATYTVTASSTSTNLDFESKDPDSGDSEGAFLDAVSVVPTASLAPSNTSWSNAQPIGISASQAITYAGEALWYKFPVAPDEQVSVALSNLGANYHVLLFSDINQAQAALSSGTPNLPLIQAESAGNNDSAPQFSPFYGAPFYGAPFYGAPFYGAPFYGAPFYGASSTYSPFYGAPFYGAPFYGAADDQAAEANSILGESSQAGTAMQTVQANTWNDTGNFYVEVVSSDGSFSPDSFDLSVTQTGGSCQGVTLTPQTVTNSGFPANVNPTTGNPYATVIIDNSTAMPQVSPTYTAGDGISSSLSSLAAATNGVVLDVAQSPGIASLMSQAKADPSCPAAVNLEATGIQSLINSYRVPSTPNNLKYVVIVGDDDAIPFFRYADAETVGPESTYQVPLLSTSIPEAALQNDFYLTNDQYGAASELQINGTTLPIQSAAVGRLVETPADIAGTISSYLAQETIKPTSTLSTGYSFMSAPASQIASSFAAGVSGSTGGPYTNDQLIDPVSNSDPWSSTTLLSSLTARAHQLLFLGAHFSASDALAADDSSVLSTQQLASSIGKNLQGSLVLGAGCHAGYTVDPADATPVTNTLSWPQAFTEAGATLIAGTGYQYGDSNYVADSDQVYVDLAQQLDPSGGAPVPVGTALLGAETQYLAGLDQLNGLEEKSLLEISLYGLPMLQMQEPASPTAATSPTSSVVDTTTNLVSSGTPGDVLHTREFDLPVAVQGLTKVTAGQLTYDQGPQGEVADPNSPIVPVMTEDVKVPDYTLTGVGFFGGTYTDQSGAPPLTGDPVTDTSQPAATFSSPVYYPQKLTNPNYFGQLEAGSDTQLGITPEQYVSDPSIPGNAIKRQFSDLHLHLFYSNNTASYGGNVPALAAPPDISAVSATETNGQVTVSANVTGDPSAGIQEVWVTYTDPPSGNAKGTWIPLDLTQSPLDPTLWMGTFTDPSPGNAVFMVQAANGIGDVSLDNNQGSYFSPTVVSTQSTSPPPSATSSLTLGGITTATYGATAGVSAILQSGSPATVLAGRPVQFTIGSASATGFTDPNGKASASIPLNTIPPGKYPLTASYAGDGTDTPASTSTQFSVTPDPTALTVSLPPSGKIVAGATNGISATLTSAGIGVAQKTVYFQVTNANGVVGGSVGVTNQQGVAQADVITLPSNEAGNSDTVTAYFGSVPNSSILVADPDYASATSGAAAGTVTDATTTVVSAPVSSSFGSKVSLSATVTGAGGGSGVPTGSVTFYDGSSALGTASLATTRAGQVASITVGQFPPGTQMLSAVYAGSNSFLGSSSGTLPDTVSFTSTISGSVAGPLTVTSGQSILITGTVSGPVTVQAGGALDVQNGSVTGPITATNAGGFVLCGATVSGPVTVTGSPGYVFVGGGPGCAKTSISGPLKLVGNTGGVDLLFTSVGGPVSVTNDGPGSGSTIEGNVISGPLSCSGNSPAPTDGGQLNSAAKESGQCSSPTGF